MFIETQMSAAPTSTLIIEPFFNLWCLLTLLVPDHCPDSSFREGNEKLRSQAMAL